MSTLGFRCFTSPEAPVVLTDRQQVAALTDEQRDTVITGFANRIQAGILKHTSHIPGSLIRFMYSGIDAIEERCRTYMRGEVVVTPAVLDADGNVTTPAVMNTPPTTQAQLRTAVSPEFITDYPQLFITNAIQAMIAWSKYDGTGTFNFYKSQIVL